MKKYLLTTLLLSSILLTSCQSSSNSSSEVLPQNELQEYFYNLRNNNFSIDYYDRYVNNTTNTPNGIQTVERNQKFYFTPYSLQTEGSFGFNAYAQDKDDTIFRYNIVDGEIVSSTPVINSSTGIRYRSIYEVTYGLDLFDFTYLDDTKDEEGYYTYHFNKNYQNDVIFASVFLYKQLAGFGNDYEVKMKIVGGNLSIKAKMLGYDTDNDGVEDKYDEVDAIVYDVNNTENEEIKEYLENGYTSKQPLDLSFYKLIHPYLFNQNYTVHFTYPQSNWDTIEYCTENAILDVNQNRREASGYLLDNHGVVVSFDSDSYKVDITGTPINQSTSEPYYAIYGGILDTSFYDLTYDTFVGYIDEERENSYIITDSQAVYTLAYICMITLSDDMFTDYIRVNVIDAEKHEFELEIPLYNRTTFRDLGTYKAHFYDYGTTEIDEVDRYLSVGEDPTTQDISNLENVLLKFKGGNYSCDNYSSAGVSKYYYTENYFYCETYGAANYNYGYIKEGESIYEFKIDHSANKVNVLREKDYALGDNPLRLPGCGSAYFAMDDLNYFSTFDDKLYDLDNYEVSSSLGVNFWKIKDEVLSSKVFNYVFNHPISLLNMGCGVLVQDGSNPYDTKLSVIATGYDTRYDSTAGRIFTYYDIGATAYPLLEAYIAERGV